MAKKESITHREIISDIKKGNFAPVYLLMGEEPYYPELIASWLEKSVVAEEDKDFDCEIFFGADSNVESVAASAGQYPMMSGKRLVMLKEAQSMDQAVAQLGKLEGYVIHASSTTVLVIIYKGKELPATSKLVKSIKSAQGVVYISPVLKEYQMGVPIADYCAEKKIGIDPEASEMLVTYLGTSLTKVFREIDKLIVAGGSSLTRITRKEVSENIGLSKEFNVFEFLTAVATKNYTKAMTMIEFFASGSKKNSVLSVIGPMFRLFSRMAMVYYAKDKSDAALMSMFGMHSSWQLKDIKTGLGYYNASQTIKAISLIRELDCKSKGIDSMQNEFDLLKECVFKMFTVR